MMKRVATEGMITGTIGATVVAAWSLMYDLRQTAVQNTRA
jgi:hypothetical protein